MNHLLELERKIRGLGWFSKQIQFIITTNVEFEGFYGKASEDWESQVIIEIKSPDEKIIKNIKVKGLRGMKIDDVAKQVLIYLKN